MDRVQTNAKLKEAPVSPLRTSVAALLMALVAVLSGCAGQNAIANVRGAEYEIREIELVGVERFKEKKLLEHLNMGESSTLLWWKPDYHYSEALVPIDRRRILELYAAYGYYDAEVESIRTEFNERRKTATVTIEVDEGEPVRIQSVDFEWPEGPPQRPEGAEADPEANPRQIETHAELQPGDPMEVPALERAVADLRIALQHRGYPFAEVDHRATVDRNERKAHVSFFLTAGPFAKIRDFHFRGLQEVPQDLVYTEVEFAKGKKYSPKRMRAIEQSVYGMNVFDSVSVEPAASEPEDIHDHELDVVIHVSESRPQFVEIGGGFQVDPNRWQQHLFAKYRHENLFGNLTRLDSNLSVGYAELPTIYNPRYHGPILKTGPRLRKKGFLEDKLVWTLAPEFELGVEQGYQFYSPSNRMGVSRFFTRFVEVSLTHNLRFTDFFAVSPVLLQQRAALSRGFRDPYLLSFFEVGLNVYLTDQILQPKNGVVLESYYDISSTWIGSQFDYHKIVPGLRAYWQAHERLQFAWRAKTGLIFGYGRRPGVPIDQRFYLGGPESMRGWGARRLSPRLVGCSAEDGCASIPIGGKTMLLGSFEVRVRAWDKLYTVAFFDAGDVRFPEATYEWGDLNYSVGPGLRYDTPLGKIRLDVGFRLDPTDRFPTEAIWALHFGLGESF